MNIVPTLVLSAALAVTVTAQSDILNTPQPLTLAIEDNAPFKLAQAQGAAVEAPERKPDIHYVPTPEDVVEEMLSTANVGPKDLLYDLGSGDGRIPITAAKKRGARGIGIDIDPQRIIEANENAKKAGVEDKVEFRKADIFKSDFKDATVISLYLLNTINVKLRPKLFAETKPGTRIVSHAFSMGDWEPDQHKDVRQRSVFYWVVPANLSGTWKVAGAAGIESLTIKQKYQKFTGTAQGKGGQREISDGKVTGEKFTFTIAGAAGEKPESFSGEMDGDRLKLVGSKAATAERQSGTKERIDTAEEQ
jgi:hypothetical protein